MNFQKIYSVLALERIQEQVKKTEQPLLVVFHADWCASCKSLEGALWRNADVQEKLKSWRLVKADVTANNAENQELLKKFGLYGPPAILFFSSSGNELSDYRIIGSVSVEDFLNYVDQVELEMKIS
jgi:thiol:disulfide interchange protein DsbD